MKTKYKNSSKFIFSICLCLMLSACGSDDKQVVDDLIRDITTNAKETEAIGRALQVIAALEQAQNLDSTKQCKAAKDIYCAMFQMVNENCIDQTAFCQEVADALFAGTFPGGLIGMNACISAASDKCQELQGNKQTLQRLCLELQRRNC